MTTPAILVGQMREMASDELSTRWKDSFETMNDGSTEETPGPSLQKWLEEMYFDGERKETRAGRTSFSWEELLDDCCDSSRLVWRRHGRF